jgi:hypothetical protein
MRRRDFIKVIAGSTVVWPLAARAQQGERTRLIGVLVGNAESDGIAQSWLAVFRGALTKLGWTEGRNLRIELRWSAGDADSRMRSARCDPRCDHARDRRPCPRDADNSHRVHGRHVHGARRDLLQ